MHICVHCPLINLFNIVEFPPQLCYYLLMEYFTSYQFHPRQYCLHELANKRWISVTSASKLLANMRYSYHGMGLSVGTMIAGWDEMVYSSSKSVVFFSCLTCSLSS
ncbi:unnamed protein product, partial [Musa textilis]